MKKITFDIGFVSMKNETRFLVAFVLWVLIFYFYVLLLDFKMGIIFGFGYFVIFYFSRFRIKLQTQKARKR